MIRQPRVVSHQLTSARWTRCLAMIVCQVLVWQPMVASAVIAQQPMFTVSSSPPNVMLMMDDSSSMAGYRLPTPPTVTVPLRQRFRPLRRRHEHEDSQQGQRIHIARACIQSALVQPIGSLHTVE